MPSPLPMYGDSRTLASLKQRFAYIFDETIKPIPGTSKPEGRAYEIEAGRLLFRNTHSHTRSQ